MPDSDPYSEFDIDPDEAFPEGRPVEGTVVTVLDFRLPERTFELLDTLTRALTRHDIHEVIAIDGGAQPGEVATGATYVCFFEVERGGVVTTGMDVSIGGEKIGEIVGYDETHAPNHLNILCRAEPPQTGRESDFDVESDVRIA